MVFPAVLCSIPVFAASFAGLRPLFADVDPATGNFDFADLDRVLAGSPAPAAVVPVHMFGRADDMDALSVAAARRGASVVEDVALAMGSTWRGRAVGRFGRLACLSFVRKMLPMEMGGAVLTDEPGLDGRVRAFVDALPVPAGGPREVASAMKAFHALSAYAAAGDWRRRELLGPFEAEFRRLLLAKTVEADWEGSVVLEELARLPDILQSRRARAEVYDTVFTHPRLVKLAHPESSLFAYPVRLEGVSAEAFLAFAVDRGLVFKRVAYPDVHPIFGPRRSLPGAARLEREAVGLPLDDDQPVSSFWEYAEDFQRAFTEFLASPASTAPFDERGRLSLRLG